MLTTAAVVVVLCAVSGQSSASDQGSCRQGDTRSYSGYQVIQLRSALDTQTRTFLATRVEFWSDPSVNSSEVTFLLSPNQEKRVKQRLSESNIQFNVQVENLQSEIERESKENSYCVTQRSSERRVSHTLTKRATLWDSFFDFFNFNIGSSSEESQENQIHRVPRKIRDNDDFRESKFLSPLPMDWTHFHPLSTIYAWLERLAAKHPDVLRLQVLGVTEEGRKLVAVHIGSNTGVQKPAIFIEGGIHAREWISPATVTFIIKELATNPNYKDLIEMYDWIIMPLVNPDGYVYSHTEDRMWRKNRGESKTILNLLSNCKGIDLNRNFAYSWGELDILSSQGGTPLPCLETFIGDSAFSEAESQAVRNVVLANRHRLVSYLSYHSFGQKIMYPWSYSEEKVPDWKELHHMANSLAGRIYEASFGQDYYNIGTASDIQYSATGGSDDWARGAAGIKWVYLIELPGKGKGFLLPPRFILPVARSNMEGLSNLAVQIYKTL